MAVSWIPYADGVSLLTLRNDINVFNSAVDNNIDTIETSITNLGINKIAHNDTGIIFVSGGVLPSISLTTAYQKVKMVDTMSINEAHLNMTADLINGTATINTSGIYKFVFAGSITANNGSIVTFNYNVNGVSLIPVPPEFIGRGSSPVDIGNHFVASLTAGSVVYIEAKADSAITLTPKSGGLMLEKTHF